jgi:hypothetical protein
LINRARIKGIKINDKGLKSIVEFVGRHYKVEFSNKTQLEALLELLVEITDKGNKVNFENFE